MSTIIFQTLHIDRQDAMRRFLNNEKLYLDMLKLFPVDPSFHQLEKALDTGDVKEAFFAAHTLKGTAANLSLKGLCDINYPLVEDLRAGNLEAAKKRFPELKKEYQLIIDGIQQIS